MKQINKKLKFLLTAFLIFSINACDSGFLEINENPNEPTAVGAEFILPFVQESNVRFLIGGGPGRAYTHIQYHAPILYADNGLYIYTPESANGHWDTFYSTILENLNQIRLLGRDSEVPQPNVEAIGLILMSWNYHLITDLWGDVPYSEANKGSDPDSEQRTANPKYDRQESIYDGLISELDKATSLIDENQSPFGSADLFFGGDMSKWKKFANSLKLRIYMRLSEINPDKAANGIQRVYNEGMFINSNEDNVVFHFQEFPNNHPSNNSLRQREDLKVTESVVENLRALNDPRLRIYAAPNFNDSEYVGLPVGREQGQFTNSEISPIGAYFVAPKAPGYILTYSEILFILAEAEVREWIDVPGSTAGELYEDAIRSNMQLFTQSELDAVLNGFAGNDTYNNLRLKEEEFPTGITEQEINDYINNPDVAWDAANWRALIGMQRWLAHYRQGLQGWFEWRRLGYPQLIAGPDALLEELPRRWVYPLIEQSLNGDNRSEAVDRMGSDNLLSRMWIDPE